MAKAPRFTHTSNKKVGMGENMGTGLRNKVGKSMSTLNYANVPAKKLKKPPRSLA